MILKYKVPKHERKWFGKRVIYCKILQTEKLKNIDKKAHLVRMLNFKGITSIYLNTDLEELNIIDKLKLKIGGYNVQD